MRAFCLRGLLAVSVIGSGSAYAEPAGDAVFVEDTPAAAQRPLPALRTGTAPIAQPQRTPQPLAMRPAAPVAMQQPANAQRFAAPPQSISRDMLNAPPQAAKKPSMFARLTPKWLTGGEEYADPSSAQASSIPNGWNEGPGAVQTAGYQMPIGQPVNQQGVQAAAYNQDGMDQSQQRSGGLQMRTYTQPRGLFDSGPEPSRPQPMPTQSRWAQQPTPQQTAANAGQVKPASQTKKRGIFSGWMGGSKASTPVQAKAPARVANAKPKAAAQSPGEMQAQAMARMQAARGRAAAQPLAMPKQSAPVRTPSFEDSDAVFVSDNQPAAPAPIAPAPINMPQALLPTKPNAQLRNVETLGQAPVESSQPQVIENPALRAKRPATVAKTTTPKPTTRRAEAPRPAPLLSAAPLPAAPLPVPVATTPAATPSYVANAAPQALGPNSIAPAKPLRTASRTIANPAPAPLAPNAKPSQRAIDLLAEARKLGESASTEQQYADIIERCHYVLAIDHSPEAVEYANQLASWALNKRGEVRADGGRLPEASTDFSDAIRLQATNWRAHHNQGVLAAQTGDFTAALAAFNLTLDINPKFAKAFSNRASLHVQGGRFNEALADYNQAIALDPDLAPAHKGKGRVCHMLGQTEEARQHFDAAAVLSPTDAQVALSRADLLVDMGRYGEAQQEYRRAMQLDGKLANAFRNLAWMEATCPVAAYRNGAEAVQHAQQAIAISGREDDVNLDTLAAAYATAGKFADAIATVERAISAAGVGQVDGYKSRLELYKQNQPFLSQPMAGEGGVQAVNYQQ